MTDLYHVVQNSTDYFTYSCRIDKATTTRDGIKYYCYKCNRYVRPDKVHKTGRELKWKK